MNSLPTNILLAKYGGKEKLKQQATDAKVALAKGVLQRIAAAAEETIFELSADTLQSLKEALGLIELRCLDLAAAWRRDSKSSEGIEFRDYCSLAFDIRRILPASETDEEKVKDVLRLAAVGVLGDRSADIRRHLNENIWPVPQVAPAQDGWPKTVLFHVVDVFLRIVRKKGWDDLRYVAKDIENLRNNQQQYEQDYLSQENGMRQLAALELVALYQLAKAVEMLGLFVGKGTPPTVLDDVDFHTSKAIEAADSGGIIELALLLRWVGMASRTLIRSTIWHQMAAYNSQMTRFKQALADESHTHPLFELLPPQRDAIQDVMNIGNRAVVVEMPTSSGKTLLAEFRMIQTKVNFADAWIAYIVPTRALVSQITIRLRRDLSFLNWKIEQATPAYEVDALEEELLDAPDSFDVLVTTPEKLDLLIRGKNTHQQKRPLGLVVLDEAHNLSDEERGLRSELVLATINRESPDTNFLLLTPFVPNGKDLATWLDDERSRCVEPSLSVNWQPNDRMLALAYPTGRGRAWGLEIKPLHVTQPHRTPIAFNERIIIEPERKRDCTLSDAKSSRLSVAAFLANALSARGSSIVLAISPSACWSLAEKLAPMLPAKQSRKLDLVREFVATECGADFALYDLLGKGIGVHHAGISQEIRTLLEWLTEEGEIVVLIATTTIAQGVNFPISNIILSTYQKPLASGKFTRTEKMRPDEFWNIAGRAGRLLHDTLGLVLFASPRPDDAGVEEYVNNKVVALASALEKMIEDVDAKGWDLNLRRLVKNDVKWSGFVQYLAHCYKTVGNHEQFLTDTEKLLKHTYAYRRLSEHKPELADLLIKSTRAYAEDYLKNMSPGIFTLVDNTGFSPESITGLLNTKNDWCLAADDWAPSRLFQGGGEGMKKLVGALLQVPELSFQAIGHGEGRKIASLLDMWVAGKSMREIANEHFKEIDDIQKRLTICCRDIYRDLTHQGSWGVGALQYMSALDKADLDEDTKTEIRMAPSKIYYGVPTTEAVVMRSLGVPRSVSISLGRRFQQDETSDTRTPRIQRAREWLTQCPDDIWHDATQEAKLAMNGKSMREVWRIVTGTNIEDETA